MRLLSYLAVATLTAAATLGAVTATGLASSARPSASPPVGVGSNFRVWSLDLTCVVLPANRSPEARFGRDPGPVLYCDRGSRATGTARGVGISASHFFITNPTASRIAVNVRRAP